MDAEHLLAATLLAAVLLSQLPAPARASQGGAVPASETAGMPDAGAAASGGPPPEIRATLGGKAFSRGQRVQLVLWVHNRGNALLTVPDPVNGGDSLHLSLKLPDGQSRDFTTGQALQFPGTRATPASMRIPAGATQPFELDLAGLTDLSQAGRYGLSLQYAWRPEGAGWHSPELHFVVKAKDVRTPP